MYFYEKDIFAIIVLLTHANKASRNVFICRVSLIVCLFKAPALTYCPFVQSSPNVQVSRPSSLLQHEITKAGNKYLHVQLWRAQQIFLSWKFFAFGIHHLHHSHCREGQTLQSAIIITVGFYQCDSQIVGVVSTLQDLSCDSHPFCHNCISQRHQPWSCIPLVSIFTAQSEMRISGRAGRNQWMCLCCC